MRSKLFIVGITFISVLTFSCSNDDSYEIPETQKLNLKIDQQNPLKELPVPQQRDSTAQMGGGDGEPSNPVPPRK